MRKIQYTSLKLIKNDYNSDYKFIIVIISFYSTKQETRQWKLKDCVPLYLRDFYIFKQPKPKFNERYI